jgi:hypothetical protein
VPHRLGRAKLGERYTIGSLDAPRVELSGPADRIQIHGAIFFESLQRLRAHAALADHCAHAVLAKDLRLIRLFPDARRRSRCRHGPAVSLFFNDRAAVIKDRASEIHWGVMLHQVCVDGITPGVHPPGQQHDIADGKRANGRLVQGGVQANLPACPGEALLIDHRNYRTARIAI